MKTAKPWPKYYIPSCNNPVRLFIHILDEDTTDEAFEALLEMAWYCDEEEGVLNEKNTTN